MLLVFHFGPRYISVPLTEDAKTEKVTKFFSAFRISQYLGAIDETNIEIKQPSLYQLHQQERPLLTQMFKLAVTTSTASWKLY